MRFPILNIFAAWFFILQVLAMGWIAAVGRVVLELLGATTHEGDVPGRLVGALLLIAAIYTVWHVLRTLPPQGKPGGNGYLLGHKLVLAANVLGGCLFVFQLFATGIESYNTHMILDKFTTAFGYLAIGCIAFGFSLIFQSAQSKVAK